MKNLLLSIMVTALSLAGLMLGYSLLPLIITFLVAIALSATAETIIHGWTQRGLSRPWAVLLTYVIGVAVLALLAFAIVPPLSSEVSALAKDAMPLYETFLLSWRQRGGAWAFLSSTLPSREAMSRTLAFRWQELFKSVLLFGESTASALVVFVLAVYWSIQRSHMTAALHGLFPAKHRAHVRRALAQVEVALGLHVVVEGVASLITLTAVFAVAAAQGLPYPILLSVLVALLRLVPFLGPPLSLLAGLLAGHSVDTTTAAVTAVAVLAIERLANTLANNMLSHRRHNAFVVLILSVATVKLGGFIGLLVAPALASIVEVVATAFRHPGRPLSETADLYERLTALSAKIAQESSTPRSRRLAPLVAKLQNMLSSQSVR